MNKKRQLIYDKSGGKCWYCGSDLVDGWHADHFYPVIRVDKKMLYPELDSIDNKVPSCGSCNMMKSSMGIEGFRNTITSFIESLNSYTTQYKFAKRYGLVKETNKGVLFWFEENNLTVKSELEMLNISDEAMNLRWIEDKAERDYFYIKFDNFLCTMRKTSLCWIVIAIDYQWRELGRTELYNGQLAKAKAAQWALRFNN